MDSYNSKREVEKPRPRTVTERRALDRERRAVLIEELKKQLIDLEGQAAAADMVLGSDRPAVRWLRQAARTLRLAVEELERLYR